MTAQCVVCYRPTPQTSVCFPCTNDLVNEIKAVCVARGLAYDLDLAISKQARFQTPSGYSSGTKEKALPIDERASDARRELYRVLDRWAGELRRLMGSERFVANEVSLTYLASWLWPRVNGIPLDLARRAHREIGSAVRGARLAIDRPVDLHYAGPCGTNGCGWDLYAREGAKFVTCRNPDHGDDAPSWPAYDRFEWLQEAVRGVLATADLIARALTRPDRPVTYAMIYGLARRGRLEQRWVTADGKKALYLVGDVMDLLDEIDAKRERRSVALEAALT